MLSKKKETEVEPAIVAFHHVESVVDRADYMRDGAPLWHGWALREAFIAGAKWQKQQDSPVLEPPAKPAFEPEPEYPLPKTQPKTAPPPPPKKPTTKSAPPAPPDE